MHYLNSATLQRYKDANVEYVQIWAAADERTCTTCGGYHTKIYPLEKAPILPLHANCRCTYLPVTDKEMITEYREENDYIELNDTTDKWAEEARRELKADEQSLVGRTKETAIIYDENGKFIFTKRGKESSVEFTRKEVKKMKNRIVSHNHPSGASFSISDWLLFKAGNLQELRAIGIDGVYYIRRTEEFLNLLISDEEFKTELIETRNQVRKKYQKIYESGKISKRERFLLSSDEYNKIFAEKMKLRYGKEDF